MDFNLTEEHLMIQQAAKDFAVAELLPGVIERDELSKFPTEQVKMMAELGFLGMMVDPKYGGSGLDSISYVLAMTEIAKVDACRMEHAVSDESFQKLKEHAMREIASQKIDNTFDDFPVKK
mgnify:CR=1 FL=1